MVGHTALSVHYTACKLQVISLFFLFDIKISQCFTVEGVRRRMGEASTDTTGPHQIYPKSAAEDGRAWTCCICCYWWRWWNNNWWRFCGFCTNNWSDAYFDTHAYLHASIPCCLPLKDGFHSQQRQIESWSEAQSNIMPSKSKQRSLEAENQFCFVTLSLMYNLAKTRSRRTNQSYCSVVSIVIGLFFPFCFHLQLSSFH